MNHPFERIHDPMTRKQLLRAPRRRHPLLPGILAACGGGGGIEGQQAETGATTVEQVLADEITVSNWPFYIDQNDDATKFPTLDQFTEETGVKVNYLEDINSNEEFFGEIQAPLSRGQGIDRDIIVPTAWLRAAAAPRLPAEARQERHPEHRQPRGHAQAAPWDPNRDYSLPWQSYITGVGYDPKKVGGEITSVEQLLDPALKGKITMLDSMEDTVGALPPRDGRRPVGNHRPAAYDEAVAKVQKAVDDGQIRQFTGNDYTGLLAKGDVTWASIAWSGDIVILQPDNPNLEFTIPDAGGMTSVDTMVIPTGGDVYTASTFMNFFYDPEIAAQVAAYVNYITPVKGRRSDRRDRPGARRGPLIFPTPEVLENLYEFNAEAIENPEYQEQWQAVIGV